MPSKKKKFIDKKSSVTFHLVHRSQKDPLQADEDAPKRVLLHADKEKLKEEERKFGVFYEDDYNYLQHLKDVDELSQVEPIQYQPRIAQSRVEDSQTPSIQLPSTVFESETSTEQGLLNKAVSVRGPQPNWDPDIVEALDEDFDYDDPDNVLEDDFITMANQQGEGKSDGDEYESEDYHSDQADVSDDDMSSNGNQSFDDEETKTQFTNYSMTSSVIKRNEGLTLLDDKFEKIFEEYEDTEIGALDHEDIEGHRGGNSEVLNNVLEEFEEQMVSVKLKDVVEPCTDDIDVVSDDSDDDQQFISMEVEAPKEKWDCESILSTYSNIYNHPTTIEEPRSRIKAESHNKTLANQNRTIECNSDEVLLPETVDVDRVCTYRPKNETAEEKKLRKNAIKQERKGRRTEKKETKKAFKSEEIRQKKEQLNLLLNLNGVKIV